MNIRGIILEGYSNAGKTSLLRAMKRLQAEDETGENSVVVLGERYSQVLNSVQACRELLMTQERLREQARASGFHLDNDNEVIVRHGR